MAETVTLTPTSLSNFETGFVPDAGYAPSIAGDTADPSRRSRFSSYAARSVLALSMLTGGAVGVDAFNAVPAHADTTLTQQVYNTGGEGLWLHPAQDTDTPSLTSPVSDLMADGTNVTLTCWQNGPNVNGDSIWDFGTNTATGNRGFMADYYINTPVTQGNEGSQLTALGLDECGSDNSTNNTNVNPQPAESVPTFTTLNRDAAAQYALDHAELPPPNSGSCTWLVSNALWAGGMPQTSEWNGSWDDPHGFPQIVGGSGIREGTIDAWGAPNLVEYLNTMPYVTVEPLGTMSAGNNDVPDARLGDIIAYIWSPPEGIANMPLSQQLTYINHLDLVTGASTTDPEYPLVTGWSENGASALQYNQRGWTWSAEHGSVPCPYKFRG